MSPALNMLSNPFLQGYGPTEISYVPYLGVSGRSSMSPCPIRSKCKALPLKITSSKCPLKHPSTICKATSGGQRRNSDFSKQNRYGFSRNRNRNNDEKDDSENLDDSEYISTKNGPLLSLRSQPTASPGPREREIVELFRKVQSRLRERANIQEDKKVETVKGLNKENKTVDSLLKLLRKHSAEQGRRKVNGGSDNEFGFDRSRRSEPVNEDKSRDFVGVYNVVREEVKEINKVAFSRPPSSFRRRSPVPRVRYEPILSVDETTSKSRPETDSESYLEPELDMDLVSGLGMEQEDNHEDVEELEIESDLESDIVDGQVNDELKVKVNAKDEEREHTKLEDLNAMKLAELKELAKARGMKGFSKLKKSELVGLLSEDYL